MIDDERSLHEVVARAVRASHRPTRELETTLGIGNGRLSAFLRGRIELRVRHLLALARLLQVPPGDFLELGCPQETTAARHRLSDWISSELPPAAAARARAKQATAESALPATKEELATLVRETVREALAEQNRPKKS